jgi:hypothetical protein
VANRATKASPDELDSKASRSPRTGRASRANTDRSSSVGKKPTPGSSRAIRKRDSSSRTLEAVERSGRTGDHAMADRITVDESFEDKRVVNARGEPVGIVSGVRGGTAYVDPDPGIADRVKSMLGWNDIDEDDYPLREEAIERVTDDEIHLREAT